MQWKTEHCAVHKNLHKRRTTDVKLTPSLRKRSPTMFNAEMRAAGVIGVRGV